jgi:DNA-binding winged helix-turn-helix (wHTH) protein/tetratricopeptide (TPR) repeat protein
MKPTRYRFGDYRLDIAARELWRADEQVAIAAKAFECLAYLLQHRDRAVGRDELIAAVWGRVDAGDTLLTQTIWRARRAIGDGNDGQNNLRTVPRFGYRWTAPVHIEDAVSGNFPASAGFVVAAEETTPATTHEPPQTLESPSPARRPRNPRRSHFVLAGVAALFAAFLLGMFHLRRQATPADVATNASSLIVVLPVSVTDPSTETAWLRFGAMDYVASRLRDARLSVMPSERVVGLAASAVDAASPNADARARLAQMTGAGYLLVPRAMRIDRQWRFALDAYHDGHAQTYQAEASSPLQAADAVAARFLEAMGQVTANSAAPPGELDELAQHIDASSLAGDLPGARRWLDSATPAQGADPRIELRHGRVAFRGGRLEEAEVAFNAMLKEGVDVTPSQRALAQMGLGGIAVRRHRYSDAEAFYSAALGTLGDHADASLLGRAYNERAIVNAGLGHLDLAVADMSRARSELERSGDPVGGAYSDINMALVAAQRGRYTEAFGMFDNAIATFGRFNVFDGLATALANKANFQLSALDVDGAVASTTRAWSLLPKFEDHRLIEFVAQNHVRALRLSGRLAEANLALDRFDGSGAQASKDPVFPVLRAALLVDQGKGPLALQLADEIVDRIEHAPAGSCSDTIPQAALVLTEAALQSRRADAAQPLLARLGEFVTSPQDPGWAFASELARAQVLAALNDPEADRHFVTALALAEGSGESDDLVTAAAPYASYLGSRGDRARAASLVARLDPYVNSDYRAARAAAQLHALLDEPIPAAAADSKARALAGERIARNDR